MRLGVYGGTFDPLHCGHLILAAEAQQQLGFDLLLWVLTPYPPHKKEQIITPVEHRLDMLKLAIAENSIFQLSQVEIERPGPHFALDTMKLLEEKYPDAELIYLMGIDSLRDLPTWHRPREFVAVCHAIAVMQRPGVYADLTALEAQIPDISQKVLFVKAPIIGISSSELRKRIAQGQPYRYFLPGPVYKLIRERHLYQS